jgi:hypothetical protein
MSVRAKFKCDAIEPAADGAGATVRFYPVTHGSAENEQFFQYTPGGECVLSTVNQKAIEQFEVGAEYYFDISRAPSLAVDPPVSDPPSDPPKAA